MTRLKQCMPIWRGRLKALFLALLLLPIATAQLAAAEKIEIFVPIPAADAPADFVSTLKARKVLKGNQTLADLTPAQQAAVRAVDAANSNPSMATSVALLAHFETLSDKKAGPFRLALIDAALPAFLMADAAKYEMIMQTNKRLHEQKNSIKTGHGIAVSIRVGSTGARLAQWQQWKDNGSKMDGTWTYIDPFGKDPPYTFNGMPIDPKYHDTKLFNADDDITNWASQAARDADPLANERVNGKAAAKIFSDIAEEHLRGLPAQYHDDLPGKNKRIKPNVMQIEFLSPTKAVSVMANAKTRQEQGWEARLVLTKHTAFLGAKVHQEQEKYNGLYAEEQLHKWGMDKGYVSENVMDPLGSAKTYKQSATSGALREIVGSDVFPDGHMDPFGWMATNYRQIFVTHAGDLDSVAKYTLRMIDWWENVGLSREDLANLATDTPGVDAATIASLAEMEKLASSLRNAKSAEAKEKAITDGGGVDVALAKLKSLNKLMMLTGQRKHLEKMTASLAEILQADAAKRTLGDRIKKPLDFNSILDEAQNRGDGSVRDADPYIAFRSIVDAYANGYANLPTDVALAMAQDMAKFVDSDYQLPGGAGLLSAELRLVLLPVLQQTTARARSVGSDIRADAAGLANFTTIADSELSTAINLKLRDLGEPDLHGYLARLQQGEITRRQVRLAPLTEGGWPRIQITEKVWSPADVAADMQRIMWLGEVLGWSDRGFAHRLAAYFNGPDYRIATVPGAEPAQRRAYADDALDGFLGLTRMLSGAGEAVITVVKQGPNGQDITREFIGTRLVEPGLNMALITFEQAVRGGEAAQKVLGLKGDIDSLTNFGKALKALTVPGPGMDRAAKAKMMATLAADGYGSFSAIVQNFGNDKWTGWMDTHMGKNSSVLGKFGGTTGVLLSTADDAFQSQESQQALYGAVITDLLVLWQPNIAAFMALNTMYQAGNNYLVQEGAKSDLIDLLVANGKWDFSSKGKPPILLSVQIGSRVIPDDAAARLKQCNQRKLRSILPKDQTNKAVGVQQILKFLPKAEMAGVPLCQKDTNGTCVPNKARLVIPREAALKMFDASPFKGSDPIILAIKDSINTRVGWWEYIDPLRQLVFDDGTQWTAERLESHGIYPPTPEDSSFVLRKPIEIEKKPSDWAGHPKDADAQWIHAGVWQSMSGGGRKMLGYSASEYWVRRQYLMECVMLDPWIKEAGRKALKADYQDIVIGDVAGRLADLDRRVRAIDARFWPNIAPSYQPYPIDEAAPNYPKDQKLAIYDHYLSATSNQRIDLRDLIAFFSDGPQAPQTLPMSLVARAWDSQNAGVYADTSTYQNFFAALRKTNSEGLAYAAGLLEKRVENLLSEITDIVVKYEEGSEKALGRISALNQFVGSADGYSLLPVHVQILPDGKYTPPNGKYGKVEDHLFPKGQWQAGSVIFASADDELLASSTLFAGLNLAGEGTMGGRLREWEDGYKQVSEDAKLALAETLAKFKTTLVDEKASGVVVKFTDRTKPFEAMIGSYAETLAKAHPLFTRIQRMEFQKHKISLVKAKAARVFVPELVLVVAKLKSDGSVATSVPPKPTSVDGLGELTATYDTAAMRLQSRADNLFHISATTPDELRIQTIDKSVAETLPLVIKSQPFVGENDPEITQKDVDKWIETVYWELARDPEFKGSVVRPDDGKDGEVVFLPGVEDVPDLTLDTQPAPEATPALLTCDASKPDPLYESRVAVVRANDDDTKSVEFPLISPGNFYLRATAFGKHSVPLARRTYLFEVKPAEIRGRLIVKGGTVDQDQGERIEVNVGGVAWYRGEQDTPHPNFVLYQSGLFRSQLCGALSQVLLQHELPPPGLYSPEDVAAELLTTGYYHARPGNDPLSVTNSNTVKSQLIEPGVFGLIEPIEIVLASAGAVPVTVETYDAADILVPVEKSTIAALGEEYIGPGPVAVDLADGDTLSASAELTVLGGVAKGDSDEMVFSVKDHSEGVTLKVDLPAYAKGNLHVTGGFKIPEGLKELGGIGGGTIWSNLLPDAGDQVLGDRFGFSNADPVALENGLVLEGVLYANDKIETLLRVSIPRRPVLPTGGQLDLGKLEVHPYATSPVAIKVDVVDWTREPINSAVTLTLDGVELVIEGGVFTGEISFEGRAQTRVLRAEFPMAGGAAFVEHEIPIGDIGDPLNPTPPGVYELRIPVYDVGSLQVTGSSAFVETALTGKTPTIEFKLGFQGQKAINTWSVNVGDQFFFDPLFPIQLKDLLQLTGRTREDRASFKGELTAKAPAIAAGHPTVLDLGEMQLEPFVDFIQVPNLINMPIEEAEKLFGDDFIFQSHRSKDAPTPADAGKIYIQSPLPHSKDKPSMVPRGLYLNVGVYRDLRMLTMPNVVGDKALSAQSYLVSLGFTDVAIVKGRPALEGEIPGIVASQSPPPGTEVNPAVEPVALVAFSDPVLVTAQIQPEPEPEPDPPTPEPEPEPPTPEPEPPTPEPTIAATALGGWNGRVRVTFVDAAMRTTDMDLAIRCKLAVPCAEKWARMMTILVEDEMAKLEAQENDPSLNIIGDVVDGMMDGIGLGIMIGMGFAGVAAIDVMFDGVDMGLAIRTDENGIVSFQLPEAESPLQFLAGVSPLSVNADGGIDIDLKNYPFAKEGEGNGTVDLTGTFTLTSQDTATLELELRGRASDPKEGNGNLTLQFAGEFTRGEPDFSPISEKLAADILQYFDNPKPKYAHLFVRLNQLMEEMTAD